MEDYIEVNGWEIASSDSDHNDWWADEIWELQSTWSPVGTKCYLTYLVDPQFDGIRKPGEAVWAVGASEARPHSIREASEYGIIVLNKKFKVNIEEFFTQLDDLRETGLYI